MIINNNIASLKIYREYSKNLIKQGSALEHISSGIKINSAKDNPNAIAQSERFRMQIRGLQVAGQNTQDGVSMLQTAEGGISEITSSLQRVRDLLVQAGGVTTDSDKANIQTEINQMLEGANDMANNTEFNGVKLLTGGANDGSINIEMLIGASVGDTASIPKSDLTSKGLGLKTGDVLNVNVKSVDNSLKLIDSALHDIMSVGSKYGALENRFESNYDSSMEISER